MLRKKLHIEGHKNTAARLLAERKQLLASRGMSETQIQRDARIKHYRGAMRQARHQLAVIATIEALNVRKAEIKAQKLAAKKDEPSKRKRSRPDPGKKEAKKAKRMAAAGAVETED